MGRKKHYKNPNKTEDETKKVTKKKPTKKSTPKKVELPKVEPEKIEVLEEKKVEPVKVEKPEVKEEPKKEEKKPGKKTIRVCGAIMLVASVILLIAGLVFVYQASRSPEAIFKRTINDFFKETDKDAKLLEKYYFDIREQAFETDADFKLSTNIEDLLDDDIKEIKDLNITGKMGFDYGENKLQIEGAIKGSSEVISAQAYVENRNTYFKTNFFDKIMDITESSDIYEGLREYKMFYSRAIILSEYNYKDYKYISGSVRRAVLKSLDSKKMTSSKETYEVLGEEVKGHKYTYTIDSKTASKMMKSIADSLMNDKEFCKRVSKLLDIDADDVKDALKEMKEESKDIDFDEKIKINVYTRGFFNKFGGIEIVADKDDKAGIYYDGKNYEFRVVDGDEKVVFTAEKEDDEYNVVGKEDGETIFKATVRQFTRQTVDVDYKIIDADEEYKGTLYIDCNYSKEKVSYDFKYSIEYDDGYDSEYIKVDGVYNITKVDKLEEKPTDNAIDIEKVSEKEFMLKLKEVIDKDEKLKGIFGESLDEYIDSLSDLPEAENNSLTDIANDFAYDLLSTEQPSVVVSELEDVDILAALTKDPLYGAINEKKGSKKDTICFTRYTYDKECIYIDPQGKESYILGNYGSNTAFNVDRIVEVAESRYGRKINIQGLRASGKHEDGRAYYNSKNHEYGLTFYEYNGTNYAFRTDTRRYTDIAFEKALSVSNDGNIYTVILEQEERFYYTNDDIEDAEYKEEEPTIAKPEKRSPTRYTMTFELLNEKDLADLEMEDVRLISLIRS